MLEVAMGRVRKAFAIGLATGAIGVLLSLVPAVKSLEDSLGLRALFLLRGSLPSPPGVAVVSIDESTTTVLGLPGAVRDWSREYHARLIDRLVEQGAAVIALDLQFLRDAPAGGDAELARAISASKRVVLVQMLQPYSGPAGEIWRWQDPIQALADGAAGLAPAPLPDIEPVSWFWTFMTTPGGEVVPTLPAVALQLGAGRGISAYVGALNSAGFDVDMPPAGTSGDLLAYMRDVRRRVTTNGSAMVRARVRLAMTRRIDDEERTLARRLAALYSGNAAWYLNFYGPPGSVCTVPYEVVLAGSSTCELKGATVFVGVGHSRLQGAEQIDTYHTVYESADGVDISGVELQATAFANLLTGTALRVPTASFAVVSAVGFALGALVYLTRTRRRLLRGSLSARLQAAGVAVLFAAAYCVAAYVLFARFYTLVPLVVPVAIQLPAALVLGLLMRPVIREEQVRAVCLAADAGGSTAIGQRLPHDAYARLMTEYTGALAHSVERRGGTPLSPQGDGFVSLWILGSSLQELDAGRLAACHAALDMIAAANRFNETRTPDVRLPLRIGLTVGAVTIRSDADRGVFEAVGDAVNVAARLEKANRELGTSVLASAQLVQDLSELQLRHIDVPLALKGVAQAPDVFELMAKSDGRGV